MKDIIKNWVQLSLLIFTATMFANCQTKAEQPMSQSAVRPLQIILMAGQSNMEGAGNFDEIPTETRVKLEAIDDRIQIRNAGNVASPIRYTLSKFKLEKYGFDKSFGPEVGLAVALAERYPEQEFLFVKTTRGGTSLYGAWNPDWSAEKAAAVEKGPQKQSTPYYAMHMQQAQEALSELKARGEDYEVAAVLWLQGENDGGKEVAARSYEENLKALIARFRSDLNEPDLPFVIGQINSTYGRFKKGPDMVRAAMVTVAEGDDNTDVIRTTTDRVWPDFPKHSDNVHYNTEGQLRWGRAFAEKLEGLSTFE